MSVKQFTGKTESDAVINAAMELGIPSTDLDYKVIDPGSNGFLGLFKKPVIIEIIEKAEKKSAVSNKTKKKVEKKQDNVKTEKKSANKKTANKVKEAAPVKETKKNKAPENLDEIVNNTEKYLNEVLRAMGLEPKLNLYYNRRDNVLNINVSGEKMGALIGKHGQTLDALQYLTSLFVNKESDSFIKIKLDTENYRERRQQTLEKLAGSIAYKVKKNKKPIYLEPMNPNERRIIHSALQKDPYVVTKSEGKDPYRKVVVMLKK
ncbi:RNA-binding cell elongation regulator Jag/EloR [Anaerostipes faecalis]|uniref:RNA-binding cell elongation regulator Jag/EloR n=1 Tax=Anaerostipes faecalis TaxID=2738446 RepID=UPI003EFD1EE5